MYCDNTGAINIANESKITKGARHFHAKVYYLREVIEFGDIKLEKVHTYDNLADPFTKALAFPKHSEHTRNIGMLPANQSLHLHVSITPKFFNLINDSQDECILKSDDRYGSVVRDIVKDAFSRRCSAIENLACLLNVADDHIGFTYEPHMYP
ncbi:hypothetical protein Tco_0754061, partial [Tanacetum coccineum]